MGPKKKRNTLHHLSPAQSTAKRVKARYSRKSPSKVERLRKALFDVKEKQVSIRKAASYYDLTFSYLQRRLSGTVELDGRNGPKTVFSTDEEESMARWLKEMAERGMGLKPAEFLDFVKNVVNKEKRVTPFKDGRPSHDWYRSFMARNSHIIEIRKEASLESCRAKLTKENIDNWYSKYRDFVIKSGLLESPKRIFNADETGFSLGSKAGKVIGPLKEHTGQVPHVTGGRSKQRLTVMFCGAADGKMLPPYFVYPAPCPRGYNPLTGAIENSAITYTQKGWMDSNAFLGFLEHFHKYCGEERPVVLLVDSVSSHVNMGAFEFAKSHGIELYRFIPNATHIMQPLDKGVFGPLKSRWYQVMRRHSRENPSNPVGKENFAELLIEAFLLFYRPLTVINSFKSSGIYPVDSTVVTSTMLKPGLTYNDETCMTTSSPVDQTFSKDESGANAALEAFESVLDTPTRQKYKERIEEHYDIETLSPCYQVYKKLHSKSTLRKTVPTATVTSESLETQIDKELDTSGSHQQVVVQNSPDGLDLLASVACTAEKQPEASSNSPSIDLVVKSSQLSSTQIISPVLQESLTFPHIAPSEKPKKRRFQQQIPDNLTSNESIRKCALKELETVRKFAGKEKAAMLRYNKQLSKSNKRSSKPPSKKIVKTMPRKKKTQIGSPKHSESTGTTSDNKEFCMGCHMTWTEDQSLNMCSIWIQCDACDGWIHKDCCGDNQDTSLTEEAAFMCPECSR